MLSLMGKPLGQLSTVASQLENIEQIAEEAKKGSKNSRFSVEIGSGIGFEGQEDEGVSNAPSGSGASFDNQVSANVNTRSINKLKFARFARIFLMIKYRLL